MRKKTFIEFKMESYRDFAQVYDEFMDNVPYEAWEKVITGKLAAAGINDGLVLDLGCGTGKLTELMAGDGYDMIGIDMSEDMLGIALEARDESGHDILYLCQDMREFELYGTVRAVICACDSLNYITDYDELVKVFSLVSNYLDPGGLFIFDMNTPYKYREELADNTFAENREDASFIWENEFDEESGLNTYDLTLFIEQEDGSFYRTQECHVERSYSMEEILGALKLAGLDFVSAEEDYTSAPAGDQSSRWTFTAKECRKLK